jgi:hypothetical protein
MPSDHGAHDRDPFREQLRAALRQEAQRAGVRPGPGLLSAALTEPDDNHPFGRWLLASAAVTVGLVLAAITLSMRGTPPGDAASTLSAGVIASPTAPAIPPPVTLADCQIYPEDARLAFSGWATTDVLHVTGGRAAPGQPVYAIVTRGLAEWMGWRSPDAGPIYPPPVGRMGCIFDPSTGDVSEIGVPMDWHPPAVIDGCPASPGDEYAGYQEIGGPRAWALLPTGPSGWVAGERAIILYRLSPPLAPGESISAWASPLDGGGRVDGAVDDVPPGAASGTPQASPRLDGFSYYVVEQPLPTSGCWVLDVAVNGRLAGSAITSVALP